MIALGQEVEANVERIRALLDRRVKGAPKILGPSNIEKLRLESKGSCRDLYLLPLSDECRVAQIQDHSDPSDTRKRLLE